VLPDALSANGVGRRVAPDDVRRVAPALEKYTQERLYGEAWKRPGLRSIVTVAALIARQLILPMPYYFNEAIELRSRRRCFRLQRSHSWLRFGPLRPSQRQSTPDS
jgi:hypothetical protein